MRVLVLGGSYFVGRHIALACLDAGHDVLCVNRGTRPALAPSLQVDRNDAGAMRAALAGQSFDVVVDTSGADPAQAFAAHQALGGRYRRWLFVSAAAVYDDDAPRPLSESAPADGAQSWGDFGSKKARTEALLRELCGAKLTILRPGYVYGPFNSLARETFVWSRLLRGRPVFVPGDGSIQASFVYVGDLAQVVLSLATSEVGRGITLNVAHPEWVTFEGFVQAAARAAGVRSRVVHVPASLGFSARDYFPFRQQSLTVDVSRLAALGLCPRTDLQAGLAATYGAYSRAALEEVARESSVDLELAHALSVPA